MFGLVRRMLRMCNTNDGIFSPLTTNRMVNTQLILAGMG